MDWTNEAIDRLRALWAEGHSTAEIGRRMGISKNAVVGKAHRLDLPARPSPIRRDPAAPRPVATGRRPTLPPLRAAMPIAPRREEPRPVVEAPVLSVVPKAPSVVRAFPRVSAKSCCWPIGEPGTKGFRFCSATAMGGKPYCTEHAALAYVRVKDRREDAA
ncbi:GcrA family cell cycle regulator [Sediminicoccus sp. KRV36]|uniref:GcrA family cell cycle regulator n=1 Tax=Sediminicoccus sp. KRV36 TaxID=3133721 RepID=UPI00200E32D4|nr:GcrA family cell cycle regulator [Sediminicoccus rosea]UPY37039.1 GcrA family cell cycle regulator [Sediminicoccus rosea]